MDNLYWFIIIFMLMSGAWLYWYNQSDTLQSMGNYPLYVPIATLFAFFVTLWIIVTFAGSPI